MPADDAAGGDAEHDVVVTECHSRHRGAWPTCRGLHPVGTTLPSAPRTYAWVGC
jgi:hypothetical protein